MKMVLKFPNKIKMEEWIRRYEYKLPLQRTHIRLLKTACNYRFKEFQAFFWPPYAFTHSQCHRHITHSRTNQQNLTHKKIDKKIHILMCVLGEFMCLAQTPCIFSCLGQHLVHRLYVGHSCNL